MKRIASISALIVFVMFMIAQAAQDTYRQNYQTGKPDNIGRFDQYSRGLNGAFSRATSHFNNTYPHTGAQDKTGIVLKTSPPVFSIISAGSSPRTYSISVTPIEAWVNGQKVHDGPDTIQIWDDNQAALTVGTHFIYYDSTGTLNRSTSPWSLSDSSTASLATLYVRDSRNWSVGNELHSAYRDRVMHSMLHNTVGARYSNGLAGTFATGSFSIAEGAFYDEDIRHSITTQTKARVWYRNGSAMTFVDNVTTPYYAPGGSLKYDNAGTLTAASAAKYVSNYVYATNDVHYPIAIVLGQTQHNTLADAQEESHPTFPNMSPQEWKLLYHTITKQTGPTFQESEDLRTTSTLSGNVITSLPATAVTYTSYTSAFEWTELQTAVTETNRRVPVACGTDINTAIFDGAPGLPLFCNLSGGVRSVTYDSDGLNPSPMSAFAVHLYYGSSEVTPLYWSWFTGGASNRIYGTGATSTFTPSVKPIFSQLSSNNYVAVQVTYSTSTGKLYCKTGTPIAVMKAGAVGPPGPPGDSAAINEAAVFNAVSSHTNNAMYLKESTLNTFKIKFVDANGYERFGITGSGKLLHMDTGGQTRFSYDPGTHSFTVAGSTGQPIMKVYSGHRWCMYRRGGTPVMCGYSGGQVVL